LNPRNAEHLEELLTQIENPPFDIEWVECGLTAIKAIDTGKPQKWINLPIQNHQLTAEDVVKFLHIDHLL
jgi:hypothetical protein